MAEGVGSNSQVSGLNGQKSFYKLCIKITVITLHIFIALAASDKCCILSTNNFQCNSSLLSTQIFRNDIITLQTYWAGKNSYVRKLKGQTGGQGQTLLTGDYVNRHIGQGQTLWSGAQLSGAT